MFLVVFMLFLSKRMIFLDVKKNTQRSTDLLDVHSEGGSEVVPVNQEVGLPVLFLLEGAEFLPCLLGGRWQRRFRVVQALEVSVAGNTPMPLFASVRPNILVLRIVVRIIALRANVFECILDQLGGLHGCRRSLALCHGGRRSLACEIET